MNHPDGDIPNPAAAGQPELRSVPASGEIPTHSSLSPQEPTSSGATKPAEPVTIVVGIGSQLGPYHLLDKLGEGGMGAVYKDWKRSISMRPAVHATVWSSSRTIPG